MQVSKDRADAAKPFWDHWITRQRSVDHKAKHFGHTVFPQHGRCLCIITALCTCREGESHSEVTSQQKPWLCQEGKQGRVLGATRWAVVSSWCGTLAVPGLSLGCPLACRDTWWQTWKGGGLTLWGWWTWVRGSWAPPLNHSEPEVNISSEWSVKCPKTVSEGWYLFHKYCSCGFLNFLFIIFFLI